MSVAAVKVPIAPAAPVPHAGQTAGPQRPQGPQAAADAAGASGIRSGEANQADWANRANRIDQAGQAGRPKKAQEGALGQLLRDAPKPAAQNRPAVPAGLTGPNGQNGSDAPDMPGPGKGKDAGRPEMAAAVAEAVETLKSYIGGRPSEMKFDYDEETGRQVFKVIDPATREVVKQYPPEEFLQMVRRLKELDKNADENGMLFDDRY
jgi:uncharacterized FlaG/YvyC family protein